MEGGNQKKNVECLNKELKDWNKANGVDSKIQGGLTVERLRPSKNTSGYPKLKAKAAATRHVARFSLWIAQRWNSGSTHDELKVAINEIIVRLYEMFATSSQFFTPKTDDEIFTLGGQLGEIYMRLYTEAAHNGERLWKMTPKVHLSQELLQYQCQVWGNPAYFWCYADEDLVGQMIEIAASCHVLTLSFTVITKWLVTAFDHDSEDEDDK